MRCVQSELSVVASTAWRRCVYLSDTATWRRADGVGLVRHRRVDGVSSFETLIYILIDHLRDPHLRIVRKLLSKSISVLRLVEVVDLLIQ